MSRPQNPIVTLSEAEAAALRASVRLHGEKATARAMGLDERTLCRAAAEAPVGRLTAEVIRGRLDRI